MFRAPFENYLDLLTLTIKMRLRRIKEPLCSGGNVGLSILVLHPWKKNHGMILTGLRFKGETDFMYVCGELDFSADKPF